VLRFGGLRFWINYSIYTCIPGGSGAVQQNTVSTAMSVSTPMPSE
jgi:hypothetical protein